MSKEEMIVLPREVVERALEALSNTGTQRGEQPSQFLAEGLSMNALRAALEQPQRKLTQQDIADSALLGNIESPFNGCMHQEHCKRWKAKAGADSSLRAAVQQACDWISEEPGRRPISAGRLLAILTNALAAAPQPPKHYDQQALDLCPTCGWKTLIPGDCCLICARQKPQGEQEPVAEQKSGSDMISVPRSLLGAACSAINRKQDAPKVLEQLRRYTVGDLSKSSVVEQQQEQEWKHRLGNLLAVIHGDGGHYIDAHGWDKAQVDAEEKIARIMTERSQPVEQEPVVWAVMQDGAICWEADYSFSNEPGWCDSDQQSVPLYTHPQPQLEPLTDEAVLGVAKSIEIQFDSERLNEQIDDILAFARAIEHAHGIGGDL